ncbi:hypothetical protein R3P38DRAFT_3453465 [Favolaschia claudopus]|uniref:Uncharacterized protein n=1 Tax=Favolaschia claudopus TaxID=2862362 RepID=A0AAW0CR58_9AGAR
MAPNSPRSAVDNENPHYDANGLVHHSAGTGHDHFVAPGGYFPNPATSGGYTDNPVTSGGYPDNSGFPTGTPNNPVGPDGYLLDPTAYANSPLDYAAHTHQNGVDPNVYVDPNAYVDPNVYHDPSVTAYGYTDGSVAPNMYSAAEQSSDFAAMAASNNELAAMLSNMRLEYNNQMQMEMAAFKASVQDDFLAVTNQRDAARAEKEALASQVAATIARLERLEGASRVDAAASGVPSIQNSTPHRSNAQSKTKSTGATKNHPTTPSPPPRAPPISQRRTPTAPDSGSSTPPLKNPPGSSRNPPPSSTQAKSQPRDGSKRKSSNGGPQDARPSATPNAKDGMRKAKAGAKQNEARASPPRKIGEHQMLQTDIDDDAQTFKVALQTHIRFISSSLDSTAAPQSASAEIVRQFELRFAGATVTELKRAGIYGRQVIMPSEVKLGVDVIEAIRSNSRILRAEWAVDFTQSPYSLYNMAMRMCAVDTFRFLAGSSHYDFFRLNTSYINDAGLIMRLYDHYVHHHLYEKWKKEIRTPGGNATVAVRNKFAQARGRLYASREKYLNDSGIHKRIQLMFSAKATSDDESTPKGPRALARPERSQAADQLVRGLEALIVQDLHDDGNVRAANRRLARIVPAFNERNAGQFQEIPKGMPIQYYDPKWFNNRPPQARAKLEAQLVVAFIPGSTDFFATSGDHALSDQKLTAKYGHKVFAEYDLDFEEKASDADNEDEEGEGDSIGSKDSDDEDINLSDAASMESFIDDADADADGSSDNEEDDGDVASDGELDAVADADHDADMRAQLASAYDIVMDNEDLISFP